MKPAFATQHVPFCKVTVSNDTTTFMFNRICQILQIQKEAGQGVEFPLHQQHSCVLVLKSQKYSCKNTG